MNMIVVGFLVVGLILLLLGLFVLFTTHHWYSVALPNVTMCGPANILTQEMEGNEYFCHSV